VGEHILVRVAGEAYFRRVQNVPTDPTDYLSDSDAQAFIDEQASFLLISSGCRVVSGAVRRYFTRHGGQGEGYRVTLLAFLIKASVSAPKLHPEFNASLSPEKDALIYQYVSVSISLPWRPKP
jgi:hypothetical protein